MARLCDTNTFVSDKDLMIKIKTLYLMFPHMLWIWLTRFTLNKIKPRSRELFFCYFSNYFRKCQAHLCDFVSLLREWKTLILMKRNFFQPAWLSCKSPHEEWRNSCGTSCGVAVELPAYSVKVKVDKAKSRKQNSKEYISFYL